MGYILFFLLIFGLLFGFQYIFLIMFVLIALQFLGLLIGSSPILFVIGIIYLIYRSNNKHKFNRYNDNFNNYQKRYYYYRSSNGNENRHSNNRATNFEDYSKYYKILGVSESSDFETIRKSYRELARKYHPDLHQTKDTEEQEMYKNKFQEINLAFNKLKEKNNM